MINDTMKNKILEETIRVFKDWIEERAFTEPKRKWFRMGKATVDDKVHCLFCIIAGEDEEEISKILDDLIEIEKKYTPKDRDVKIEEDYTKRVDRF